ncbi:MAG: PhoH family protein [Gammaproteobacteria bacterium]|nr:PhoH family protein [Gammaproteobacteria bacterium]
MKTITFQLQPEDNNRLNNLCGQLDENLHQIERHLAVEINHRSHTFKIIGPEKAATIAHNLLNNLYANQIPHSPKELDLMLQSLVNQTKRDQPDDALEQLLVVKTSKATLKPRGANQQLYIKRINEHDISFGIGPAGTGKTYIAVACAVAALESELVSRIVLVRPAVEAGENLGFLPGDLSQKVDPYLRPMYDALYELMGAEKVIKLIEKNVIEVAPLAYMRGRTLNDAFIILDESQNTTKEQMKMFLTRIGFNSSAIITGDITQIDLPKGKMSGLRHVIDILAETPGISFTFFDSHDVVRHPLVQAVVEAYQEYEALHGV